MSYEVDRDRSGGREKSLPENSSGNIIRGFALLRNLKQQLLLLQNDPTRFSLLLKSHSF